MFDPQFEFKIEDEDHFELQEKYKLLEIECGRDGSDATFTQTDLSPEDITGWTPEKFWSDPSSHDTKSRLKVLQFTVPNGPFDDDIIPCSQEMWRSLIAAWRLPKYLLDGMVRFTGTARSLHKPYGIKAPGTIGAASSLFYSKFAVVYDVQANLTLALVVMDVSTAEELATNVEKSKSAAYNPTLIPLLVLEEETQNALVKQLRFSKQSSETARNIGLNPWSRADNDTDQQKDLLSLSTELTKVAQQIAQSKERCHNTLRAIEKTAEMHVHYTQICESKRLPLDDPVMSDANARMDCVLELALGLVRRAERCQEDIQANIQTMYSMVSNRDSRLNYQAAEASIKLAEITRRDSADMRVIAAVTLIFLPATFVATLFSTSFFDFSPKDTHRVVSNWIWLYWTITAALTIAVLAGWVTTSRMLSKWHGVPLPAVNAETKTQEKSDDKADDEDSSDDESSDGDSNDGDTEGARDRSIEQDTQGAPNESRTQASDTSPEEKGVADMSEGKVSRSPTWQKSAGLQKRKTGDFEETGDEENTGLRPWQRLAGIRGLQKRKTDEIA